MKRWIPLFFLLASCHSADKSELASFEQNFGSIPELTCPAGQSLFTYSLVGTNLPEIEGMESGSNSRLHGTRLDFCVSDELDAAKLKRVVKPVGQGGFGMLYYGAWTIEDNAVQEGVLKLLAEQDYSELKIESDTISLNSAKANDLSYAVLKLRGEAEHERTIYGEIFDIDVLSNAPRDNSRLVKQGPIEIQLNYQITGSVGMYVSYFFQSVVIKDNNPALPAPVEVTLDKDLLASSVLVDYTHHGLTDSVTLITEDADYSIGPKGLTAHYKKVETPDLVFPLGCISLPNCGVGVK